MYCTQVTISSLPVWNSEFINLLANCVSTIHKFHFVFHYFNYSPHSPTPVLVLWILIQSSFLVPLPPSPHFYPFVSIISPPHPSPLTHIHTFSFPFSPFTLLPFLFPLCPLFLFVDTSHSIPALLPLSVSPPPPSLSLPSPPLYRQLTSYFSSYFSLNVTKFDVIPSSLFSLWPLTFIIYVQHTPPSSDDDGNHCTVWW